MSNIIAALGSFAQLKAFIVYRLDAKPGTWKLDKVPVDPYTGKNTDAQLPGAWMSAHEALTWATSYGLGTVAGCYGVGVVLHEGLGLGCVDIDDCLQADGTWTPLAAKTCQRFPGAAVEVSLSGRGLHIFFRLRGASRAHSVKNVLLGMEAYDNARFIALGDAASWVGSIEQDCTEAYDSLLVEHFPPRPQTNAADWSDHPVPEWSGPPDTPEGDAELINRALRMKSPAAIFGGKVAFVDLWTANTDRLAGVWPSAKGDAWDRSSADQAFFNHLSYWTGSNCERMLRLARASALVRPKWDRDETYMRPSILDSCATQKKWYNDGQAPAGAQLADGAPGQQPVTAAPAAVPPAVAVSSDAPAALAQPVPIGETGPLAQPAVTVGLAGVVVPEKVILKPRECPDPGTTTFMDDHVKMFDGCMYVEDLCQILMPEGVLLDKSRFDNRFPGVIFSITADGTKPTMSAWEAFVQSQVFSFPKVRGLFFSPTQAPGAVVWKDGMQFINSYVPVETEATEGDYMPFWGHLKRILPRGDDAEILWYYMCAMVQFQGTKFQWCPFIQGVEGNGKSAICEVVEYCIGPRYTHHGNAAKLGSEHNAELYGKTFLRFDEVKIDHQKGSVWETLKTMVTQTKLEIRAMYTDKVTREVCFNMILLSNHKNGIRKTRNDRRLCTLFCAQQNLGDLLRDGMIDDVNGQSSKYFDGLWHWLETGGYAIINHALRTTAIPDKYNPAGACRRAPDTTSTGDAIHEGMGNAEQELLEAINVGHRGFRDGWVDSDAMDILLARVGKGSLIPRKQRAQLLFTLGYTTHPALGADGRVTTRMTNGSRPILYLKTGHAAMSLTVAKEVVAAFEAAQKD